MDFAAYISTVTDLIPKGGKIVRLEVKPSVYEVLFLNKPNTPHCFGDKI